MRQSAGETRHFAMTCSKTPDISQSIFPQSLQGRNGERRPSARGESVGINSVEPEPETGSCVRAELTITRLAGPK